MFLDEAAEEREVWEVEFCGNLLDRHVAVATAQTPVQARPTAAAPERWHHPQGDGSLSRPDTTKSPDTTKTNSPAPE